MKSHLQSYPCPLIINYFWNLGFLLGITILLQIISGIFLGLHYTSDINSAYFSIFFIIREIYYGWCLRYLHSNGSSFVFLLIFLHLGRAISYGSYFYNPNTWFSGIIIIFFLMGTAFMGYVLPLGQMSLWGVTVITNLLSAFPSLIEWLCGGHYIYNPTFKRFFVFHFLFPFLLCGFLVYHIFNLHFLSSNNPLRNSTNNKIAFFPFIISKDLYGKILILYLYLLQIHFGFSSFSHPDNALEACGLLTPLHIVPEWYFLCQYAMLKAVPNKNAGFIILFTSIFILFYFMRSLSISFYFIIFFTNRFNGFYLCFWFLLLFSFIWIGGQFPVDNFLSYGRILTLHYYYLLICILFIPVRMSFTRFIPPVHLVHSSSRTKGQRTGVKWGEWWTRGMNGSEPRDERNMGSIDSWIPFVSLRHPRSLSLISLPVGDGSEDERSEPSASRSLRSRYAEGMEGNDVRKGPNMTSRRNAEGTDQTVTKGLSSSSKFSGSCVPTLQTLPTLLSLPFRRVSFGSIPSPLNTRRRREWPEGTLRGGNVENGAGIIWGVSRQFPRFLSSYHRFLSTGIILLVTRNIGNIYCNKIIR